jgi:tetratricopeptide (TPR) repeat protein
MPGVTTTIRVGALLGAAAMAVAALAGSPVRALAQAAFIRQPAQPSADAVAAYNRANVLDHKGDHVAARRQFDEAIELEPGNRSAFVGRCIAYRHLRDYEHAMRDCEEAIRLAPDDAEAYLERGVTRLLRADRDAAVADFTEAIRLSPQYGQAFNNRAAARFHSAAVETVLPDLDEAVRLNPDLFDAHFNRAAIFIKLSEWDRALDECGEAIRLRPDSALAHNECGVAYRGKGDRERAASYYEKALSLNPSGWSRVSIEANLKESLRANGIGGNDLAPSIDGAEFGSRAVGFGAPSSPEDRAVFAGNIAFFDNAIERNSADKASYFHRGQIYAGKRDPDRAIADFSEALRIDPDYRDALNRRAQAYQSKGADDDAIADFSNAIRIDSRDPVAHLGRCASYNHKRDWDHVIAACSEALRVTPLEKSTLGPHNQALWLRGDAYFKNGEDDRAFQDYTDLMRGGVEPVGVLTNRGIIYLRRHDWDRAVAVTSRAMQGGGRKYPRALAVRGQAFVGRGDYGSAIKDFDDAIQLDPKSAAAFVGRGEAYEKQGDRERAIADYRQALALEPEAPTKDAAQSALTRLGVTPQPTAHD